MHPTYSKRKLLLFFGDFGMVWLAIYCVGRFGGVEYFSDFYNRKDYLAILAVYILLFHSVFELYDLSMATRGAESFKRILASNLFVWAFFLFTPYITPLLPQRRIVMAVFLLILWGATLSWRGIYIKLMVRNFFQINDTLLFCPKDKLPGVIREMKQMNRFYNIVAIFNEGQDYDQCEKSMFQIHRNDQLKKYVDVGHLQQIIFYPGMNTSALKEIFPKCIEKNIQISNYGDIVEDNQERIPLDYLNEKFFEDFMFNRRPLNRYYTFLARIANLVLSAFFLILLGVLLPLILLGNLLGNRGSLFYKQERVGEHGKVFRIYKLRSMDQNAEQGGARFTQKGDLRITPFGKILRKLRIDELPQVINVFKGEMSFIGPRPERPVFVQELEEVTPIYSIRHTVKPGLTGWAQVKFGYGSSLEDSLRKLEYDLYFIKHRSFMLDLRIVIRTIGTILMFKGE